MENQNDSIGYLNTPLGILQIKADDGAVKEITFTQYTEGDIKQLEHFDNAIIKELKQELLAYFDRKLFSFHVPLAPEGTQFQKKVWDMLSGVSYGNTNSYKDLALKLNSPKSIRAIGTANGANPIPIIIPCHRVIGSDGSLVGYAGGLWRKQFLLGLEGAKSLNLF